jgi:hypothetical protein
MLTPLNNSQFISRIFSDATGRQFRLTFLVAIVNGEVRGHLISAEPVSKAGSQSSIANYQLTGAVSDGSFCLPIICNNKKPATTYVSSLKPIATPYFSLEFLINSQPTRAPSCN